MTTAAHPILKTLNSLKTPSAFLSLSNSFSFAMFSPERHGFPGIRAVAGHCGAARGGGRDAWPAGRATPKLPPASRGAKPDCSTFQVPTLFFLKLRHCPAHPLSHDQHLDRVRPGSADPHAFPSRSIAVCKFRHTNLDARSRSRSRSQTRAVSVLCMLQAVGNGGMAPRAVEAGLCGRHNCCVI